MGVIGGAYPPDHDFIVRDGQVHMEIVQSALTMMVMRRLDNDIAAHDLVAVAAEFRGKPANARLERRRRRHVSKGDLYRQCGHRGVPIQCPQVSQRTIMCIPYSIFENAALKNARCEYARLRA